MEIKLDGEYQTRGGRKVRRVLCVDRNDKNNPVVVEFEDGMILHYKTCGRYFSDETSNLDLIEIPPAPPLHETLKRDDKVMVRGVGDGQHWVRRHFSHYKDGAYHCFDSGRTSWSSGRYTTRWLQCRLPTPEELGEQA